MLPLIYIIQYKNSEKSQINMQNTQQPQPSVITTVSSTDKPITEPTSQSKQSSNQKKTPSKHVHLLRYTDFQFIKVLGMGAYGKVQLVRRKGIKYALKIIQKRTLAKQGKQYQAFIQRQLLRRMNHPGVVSLKTCFQDRANLYYCLQYCQGGDFTTFIRNNQSKITHELRVFYLAEIVNIIQYFQQIGIVHRDLKPQNILLSQKGHLKLIDFATAEVTECKLVDEKFKEQLIIQKKASQQSALQLSKQIADTLKISQGSWKSTQKSQSSSDHQQPSQNIMSIRQGKRRKATFVGTCYYVPPQLLQKQVCYPATDLWALGCIMYQLYYLNPPFDGVSQFQVFQKIKNIDYIFPHNQHITQDAKDLIKKLLQKNPQDRLGCNSMQGLMMSDLKNHKFFKGVNFQTLFHQQVPLMEEQPLPTHHQHERLVKIDSKIAPQYEKFLQDKQKILIHGIIQKRTFINYNIYYLIIFKNLKILRIKVLQPGKTRETFIDFEHKLQNLNKDKQLPAQLIDQNMFKLITKQKIYKFKCAEPQKWVTIVNNKWKQLREDKRNKGKRMLMKEIDQIKEKDDQLDNDKDKEKEIKLMDSENQTGQIQKQCKSISQTIRTSKIQVQI